MHRIDGPGATVDNRFTDGDPVAGIPATMVTDDWANDVQENIIAVLVAAEITPTKGRAGDLLDSIKKLGTGRLLRTTIYINNAGTLQSSVDGAAFTNASSTFTKHPDAVFAEGEVQAGGGSGGNAASTASAQVSAGSGGAGGGYAWKRAVIAAFNGLIISVGGGGAAGALAAGGASSIGGLVSASGGGPGATGANTTASNAAFGLTAGGLGANGDINAQGGQGFSAFYTPAALSGKGGSSMFGDGGASVSGTPNTGTSGTSATSYGSGGSGAANGQVVATVINGGAGKGGMVIIKEYA